MQIKTIYKGELRTEATHLKSNNLIVTDAPIDNNGKGEAFSPTDLLCASLSCCMMTLMGIYAKNNGLNIDGMTSEVTKIMAANPRRVAEVKVHFEIDNLEATESQIKALKNAALTCPVGLSLSENVTQTISFSF